MSQVRVPLSEVHRDIHKSTIGAARRNRNCGEVHAAMLQLAAKSRMYFKRCRELKV
jgi:hypothetical protein